MIPVIFCGADYRDWPRWAFWKRGHREHEHMAVQRDSRGAEFEGLAFCPGAVSS